MHQMHGNNGRNGRRCKNIDQVISMCPVQNMNGKLNMQDELSSDNRQEHETSSSHVPDPQRADSSVS